MIQESPDKGKGNSVFGFSFTLFYAVVLCLKSKPRFSHKTNDKREKKKREPLRREWQWLLVADFLLLPSQTEPVSSAHPGSASHMQISGFSACPYETHKANRNETKTKKKTKPLSPPTTKNTPAGPMNSKRWVRSRAGKWVRCRGVPSAWPFEPLVPSHSLPSGMTKKSKHRQHTFLTFGRVECHF